MNFSKQLDGTWSRMMLENDLSLITSLIDKDITHNYEDGIGVVYNRESIKPNKC